MLNVTTSEQYFNLIRPYYMSNKIMVCYLNKLLLFGCVSFLQYSSSTIKLSFIFNIIIVVRGRLKIR